MKLPDDFDIDSLPVIGEGAEPATAQAQAAQPTPPTSSAPITQAATQAAPQPQPQPQPQAAGFDLDSLPEIRRFRMADGEDIDVDERAIARLRQGQIRNPFAPIGTDREAGRAKVSRKVWKEAGFPEKYGRSQKDRDEVSRLILDSYDNETKAEEAARAVRQDGAMAQLDATRPAFEAQYQQMAQTQRELDYMDALKKAEAARPDIGVFGHAYLNAVASAGRDVGEGELIMRQLPIIGAFIDADDAVVNANFRRFMNGEFKDSLAMGNAARNMGVPEDVIADVQRRAWSGERTAAGFPIVDQKKAAEEWKKVITPLYNAREAAKGRAVETLQEAAPLTATQEILRGAITLPKMVVDLTPLGAGITSLPKIITQAERLIERGDSEGTALAKSAASVGGEYFIWNKLGKVIDALPGVGNAVKSTGQALARNRVTGNVIARNAGQILEMNAKSGLTELVNDVVGMDKADGEEKKAFSEWFRDFVSVPGNAKKMLMMLPAHLMMKGVSKGKQMLSKEGRDAAGTVKAQRAIIEATIGEEAARGLSDADVQNIYKIVSSPNLTEKSISDTLSFIEGNAGTENRQGALRELRKQLREGREQAESRDAAEEGARQLHEQDMSARFEQAKREEAKRHGIDPDNDPKRFKEFGEVYDEYRAHETTLPFDEWAREWRKQNTAPARVEVPPEVIAAQEANRAAKREAHAKREGDINAAFANAENEAAREAKRKARADEAAERERAERERQQAAEEQEKSIAEEAARKNAEAEGIHPAVEEAKAAKAEAEQQAANPHQARLDAWPEYAAWLKKNGMKNNAKNWNKFVAQNDLDPGMKVETKDQARKRGEAEFERGLAPDEELAAFNDYNEEYSSGKTKQTFDDWLANRGKTMRVEVPKEAPVQTNGKTPIRIDINKTAEQKAVEAAHAEREADIKAAFAADDAVRARAEKAIKEYEKQKRSAKTKLPFDKWLDKYLATSRVELPDEAKDAARGLFARDVTNARKPAKNAPTSAPSAGGTITQPKSADAPQGSETPKSEYSDKTLKELYDHDDRSVGSADAQSKINAEIEARLAAIKESDVYKTFAKKGTSRKQRAEAVREWAQKRIEEGANPDALLKEFDDNVLTGLGKLKVVRPADVMAAYDAVSEVAKAAKPKIEVQPSTDAQAGATTTTTTASPQTTTTTTTTSEPSKTATSINPKPKTGYSRTSHTAYDEAKDSGSTGAVRWHHDNGGRIYKIPVDVDATVANGGKVVLKGGDSATERINELLNGRELRLTKSGKLEFKGQFKGGVPVELRPYFGRELEIGGNPDHPYSRSDMMGSAKGDDYGGTGTNTNRTWADVENDVFADRKNYEAWKSRVQRDTARAKEEKALQKQIKSGKAKDTDLAALRKKWEMEDFLEQGGSEDSDDYRVMERDLEALQSGEKPDEGFARPEKAGEEAGIHFIRNATEQNGASGVGSGTESESLIDPETGDVLYQRQEQTLRRRLQDQKFKDWAKKHGVTPTKDHLEMYDREQAKGAFKVVKRWIKGVKSKFENRPQADEDIGTDDRAIHNVRGDIIGKWNKKTNEVTFYPGANAETVAHEIGWHATYDHAEKLAAMGDTRLLDKLQQYARGASAATWAQTMSKYGLSSDPRMLIDEVGATRFTAEHAMKIKDEADRRAALKWYGKAWEACKDAYKSMLTKMGFNKTSVDALNGMSAENAVEFMAKAMAEGKNFAKAEKKTVHGVNDAETIKEKYVRTAKDKDNILHWVDDFTGGRFHLHREQKLAHGEKQRAFNRAMQVWDGIVEAAQAGGVKMSELDEYMRAKGAADRNRRIRALNGRDNGSGISDVDAARTVLQYERGPKGRLIKDLAQRLWDLQREGLMERVRSGLIDARFANQLMTDEPFHVPRHNRFNENGEFTGYETNAELAAAEWHKAEGRTTDAGNALGWIMQEYCDAFSRGAENRVRQRLAMAVAANPELGRATIVTPANEARLAEQTKHNKGGNQQVVIVKQNGQKVALELNGVRGERVARAMTGRGMKEMKPWVKKALRIWASTATEWSPTFAIRNIIADSLDVMALNIGDHGLVKGLGRNKSHVANMARLAKDIWNYSRTGKTSNQWIKRFVDAGGLIGGMGREGFTDANEVAAYFGDKITLGDEPALKKAVRSGKNGAKLVVKSFFGWVDRLNKTTEMMNRLADFKTCVERGMNDRDAAAHARDITVDFNEKGEMTGISNALYMFSNSTMGAAFRQVKSLKRHGAQLATTMLATGFVEGLLECIVNGDESEREKAGEGTGKDVNEYTRANSLYFRVGGTTVRLPFHAGPLSVIKYTGNCAARYMMGLFDEKNTSKMSGKDAAANVGKEAASLLTHFVGLGDAGPNVMQTITPTMGQWLVQLAQNIDYADRPIVKPKYTEAMPRSQNGRRSTAGGYKWIAEAMNELSGGNAGKKGNIDYEPEVYKAVSEAVGKNVLRDVTSSAQTIGYIIDAIRGEADWDVRNIPVARDFVRKTGGNTQRYYESANQYRANRYEFQTMIPNWTPEERKAFVAAHPWAASPTMQKMISEIADLQKMEDGFVKTGKSGKWVERKTPLSEERKEQIKKILLRKQARFLEIAERRGGER